MDRRRDRDVLKGIFAKATSIKFTAKLQEIQNRTAVENCKDELEGILDQSCNMEKTSLIVSNAMTNEQWPHLAQTLEYIFGLQDLTERAGGGLEAHPRLKEDILCRSRDNNTFMRQAHEIINTISPPSFNISLSFCYDYTMTYKKNAAAAE